MLESKNKLYCLFEYLFVIFTILQGNSVYFCHDTKIVVIIWEFLLFCLCLYSFNIKKNDIKYISKVHFFILIFAFISICILTIYYFYYPFSLGAYLLLSINPTMLMLYFSNCNYNDYSLFKKFVNVMYILALISIICYLLFCLTKWSGNTSISYRWGSGSMSTTLGYFGLWFHPVTSYGYKFLGLSFPIRNTGIFAEAPVYSYLLTIALMMHVFLNKHETRISNFKLIVFLIAIILTFSTNGIILSIVAILIKGIENTNTSIKNTDINGIKRWIYIISIPFIVLIFKLIIDDKKYASINDINSSYSIRYNDMFASIHAWMNHLIIGNGLGNNNAIYAYISNVSKSYLNSNLTGTAGITSDFFAVLAYGGILLALFYIIPTILSFVLKKSIRDIVVLSFVYFLLEGVFSYYVYVMILAFSVIQYTMHVYMLNKNSFENKVKRLN